MARIRTIKPEFFRHEGLQDLEAANPGAFVMLVFAGLWGHCDKAGRFEWKPRTLKLDILPFLDFDMAATLALLERAGQVRRYEAGGKQYGVIESFSDHQRIGGKEAQEDAKYPEPVEYVPSTSPGSTGEALVKQSGLQEGKGKEEEGKRKGTEKRARRAPATPMPPDFEISDAVRTWAEGKGYGDLPKHLESFKLKAQAKGYVYADWDAAFRGAIVEDWAAVRRTPLRSGAARQLGVSDETREKARELLFGKGLEHAPG